MFWIIGKLNANDKPRRVTWANGSLGGDELAGYRIRQYIKEQADQGQYIGLPTGPALPASKALTTPLTALCAICAAMSVEQSGGELPSAPSVPEGAII
jgi:hypothetical protein